MIYEVRTYRIAPHKTPEFIKIFGEAYEHRKAHSPLSAFLFSEIGPLNQVIHVWPYEDAADRERVRVESGKDGTWPPKVSHLAEHMNSEIFTPFAITPTMGSGNLGPIFEWRSYMLKPGEMGKTAEAWSKVIDQRTELSPLVMAMQTEVGDLNKFVHIWGYESLNHRSEVRAKSVELGIWPPKGGGTLITQENKIMLAAPFSPLQ